MGRDFLSVSVHELGILDSAPDPAALRAAREYQGEGADPMVLILLALDRCGVVVLIDPEHDKIPVPHDWLVRQFAEKSRGRFCPEDIRQTWNQTHPNDDEAGYTITFRHGGRDWSFDAENYRDYFDTDAVFDAVNAVLEESGVPERFWTIGEAWLFTSREAARSFGEEIGLPPREASDSPG